MMPSFTQTTDLDTNVAAFSQWQSGRNDAVAQWATATTEHMVASYEWAAKMFEEGAATNMYDVGYFAGMQAALVAKVVPS